MRDIYEKYLSDSNLPKFVWAEICKLGINIDTYDKNNAILAGGSVATIIYNDLFKTQCKIKDIDIFSSSSDTILFNEFEDYPTTIPIIESGMPAYRIKGTKYEGLVNMIEVAFLETTHDIQNYCETIINGFDINCCQIGMDINRKKIIYTEAFMDFLLTKEIKVINPFSLASTFLRLLHKHDVYTGSLLDIKKETEILIQSWSYYEDVSVLRNKILNDNPLYVKYKNIVDEYFFIERGQKLLEFHPLVFPKYIDDFNHEDNFQTFKDIRKFYA